MRAQRPTQTPGPPIAAPQRFFICYSRRDSGLVERICAALEMQGVSCWMDKESIAGSDVWRRSVVEGIRETDGVIFFASESSYQSTHVARELTVASEQFKRILPVRLDDSAPVGEFVLLLAGIQWVRYSAPTHGSDVARIIQALNTAAGTDRSGTRAPSARPLSTPRRQENSAFPGRAALLIAALLVMLLGSLILLQTRFRGVEGPSRPIPDPQTNASPASRTATLTETNLLPVHTPPAGAEIPSSPPPSDRGSVAPSTVGESPGGTNPPRPSVSSSPRTPPAVTPTMRPEPAYPLEGVRIELTDPQHATPKP